MSISFGAVIGRRYEWGLTYGLIYSVSQKKSPPPRFSGIFSQTVGIFLSKFYTPVICSYLR